MLRNGWACRVSAVTNRIQKKLRICMLRFQYAQRSWKLDKSLLSEPTVFVDSESLKCLNLSFQRLQLTKEVREFENVENF